MIEVILLGGIFFIIYAAAICAHAESAAIRAARADDIDTSWIDEYEADPLQWQDGGYSTRVSDN